jgi:hypothetical protein
MTNVPWWNIVSYSNIETRRRDVYEKIVIGAFDVGSFNSVVQSYITTLN